MIYERIKELCKQNGISISELEKEIGVAKGSICKIDRHKPNSNKMQAISKRLNTTVDYLITGKDMDIVIEMADRDAELIRMDNRFKEYAIRLSKLSKDDQTAIMQMIDRFSK